ncbi:ABC transporter permease [Zongyangia hominis]|uniref:ABC transporter permease n=1 Tax=Zongyangia hominis TaxID=2763677 RepID=A0A926ICH7_9FIRM|nr:ABC transporter permease [Zongyangia hominis]MBC8571232.1 ABC transporter permease [Zongyangia hominis]
MTLWKRAVLYFTRKKGKSILLFFILLVMVSLALIGISVQWAAQSAASELRENLGAYFKLENDINKADQWKQRVTPELCQKVMEEEGVKDYNGMDIFYLNTGDLQLTPGYFSSSDPDDPRGMVPRFLANTKTELHDQFLTRSLELSEGRHIAPDDVGKCLISETLAGMNGLKIGDTITGAIDEDIAGDNAAAVGKSFSFEVVGIYRIVASYPSAVGSPERDLIENYIFTDSQSGFDAASVLRGNDAPIYRYGATFFVKDPRQIGNILSHLEEREDIDWPSFKANVNDVAYQTSARPLERLSGFITVLIVIIMAVSVVLLSLILLLWIRNRIHEIGIYLSIGIRKRSILGQFIAECMMIAVIAFAASFLLSSVAANHIGNAVLSGISASQTAEESSDSSFSPLNDPNAPDFAAEETQPIQVKVGLASFLTVVLAGTGVIVLSVSAASLSIIRLKPKNILSNMS